jgi:hypothetical protein
MFGMNQDDNDSQATLPCEWEKDDRACIPENPPPDLEAGTLFSTNACGKKLSNVALVVIAWKTWTHSMA